MPAPANTTAGTAFVIASLPYSTTQDVNDGGTTYPVWYVITPDQNGLISVWGLGDLSTYKPTLEVFSPDGVTSHPTVPSTNKPLQFYGEAGVSYFLKFLSSTGNVSPAVLTLTLERLAETSVPAGSIAVNDDSNRFPLVLLSATDALPLATVYPFPAGEQGDILDDGTLAVEDISGVSSDDVKVALFDGNLDAITTNTFASSDGWQRTFVSSNRLDRFYLGWNADYDHFGGAPSFRTLSKLGVAGSFVELEGTGLLGLAPSNDETKLYYSARISSTNKPIKVWDLINNLPLSDLVVHLANYTPQTILVLADGSLIVLYVDIALDTIVKHYSAAGATLHTHSYGSSADPRMASSRDQTTYWIWLKPTVTPGGSTTGESQFKNVAADGTVISSVSASWFEKGLYGPPATLTPTALFGHSESCPFWITRTELDVAESPVMPEPGSQIDNSVPCCDCPCSDGGTPTGNAGPVTPPVTAFWYRRCTGGGEVPSAADVVEPEDWHDEFPPKEPDAWLTLIGRAGSPTERDERWGLKPLSDTGRFVAGRLGEVGSIERRSSDKNGYYAPARMRVVAQDDDGSFRERLGDPTRRDLVHREARFEVSSYAGRKAGLDPIPRMQGRIVDVQPGLERTAIIEIQDIVGSQFGPLDPQKTIGLEVGDEHPSRPESSKGRIYPILLGEKSDAGATDNTGAAASIGMMPVVDCGDQFLPGETPDPEGRLFNDALTAVDDKSDVNLTGTGGTINYPTRVFVAPIIADEIGPFSNVPTGFLDDNGDGLGGPSVDHAHRAVWMDIAGGADEYLAVFTKVPGFHPQTNPTVDLNARYQIVSGTSSMPAFPPRNGGVGPQWDFFADFLNDADGAQWGVLSISAPLNLNYTITGTPGTRRVVYAVSAFATLGESPRSAVLVVNDAPDVLDAVNNVVLMWDPPADNAAAVIAYRIRGRETNPPTTYLRITEIGVSPIPLTYTDDGTDAEKAFNVSSGDALVSENVWAWIACALGDVDIHEVYGSDGAEGDTPKRRLIDWDEGTIMGPDSTGWPEAERYRVVGGIRQSGFYARGLPLKHHREGAVTFAWNGCGWKDDDGLLVDQVFRMLLLFLNEVVEKNNGEGYRDGAYGPIETFANGNPKFLTSKFEAAQQQTIDWLTPGSPVGLGYVGTIVVTESTALAEIIRRFFTDYGGHGTTNHRGQWYPFLPNPEPEAGAGRLYAERREIARLLDHRFAKDEQENRVVYSYDYNYDTQAFRNTAITVEDAASITAHGGARIGVFQAGERLCYYANDQTTIEDRWQRHLTLYAYAPRYVQWATYLKSLADYNGDPARFSHRREGLGLNGESGTPGVILHTSENYSPGEPREVIQTAMLFRTT